MRAAHKPTGKNGTDLYALADNRIAVTPLRLDLTDEPFLTQLAELFPYDRKDAGAGRGRQRQRMEFMLTLRRRGISDQAVLRAMDEVPREHFVEARFADAAYADQALPIACGQTISQPYVVAYMTEQLARARATIACSRSAPARATRPRCCRGWRARWSRIERYRTLADGARSRLKTLGYDNVEVLLGDGLSGDPLRAPYDRIIVTAAAESIPQALVDQLADDGIMILPLGPHGGPQELVRLTKTKDGVKRETLIGGALRAAVARPGEGIVSKLSEFGPDPVRVEKLLLA